MEESKEIITNDFQPPVSITAGGNMAVSASRESNQILGAIMSAKRYPRDRYTAFNNILKDCERYTLAEKAEYAFPRGGQTVTGPSIRLAECLAQNWGNLDYGITELERTEGESTMEAYCYDLENNVRRSQKFVVRHQRTTKQGTYKLTDDRDIYELTANGGSRRLRSCILSQIPGDVQESAIKQCRKTLASGKGKRTKEERIGGLVVEFDKIGVKQLSIEKRLNHSIDICTDDELAEYVAIYNSIKEGIKKREDWFEIGNEKSNLTDKFLNQGE